MVHPNASAARCPPPHLATYISVRTSHLFATLKGYGASETLNILLSLVFTLSECSTTTGVPGPESASRDSGDDNSRRASGNGNGYRSADSRHSDSRLSAGTDALRLACLQCLEVRYHMSP